ncbi:hypothetical protein HA466_0317550 [Hirschfeldia incana]|nr:hypothetical protein HA466_0317550 [Hirschfeldia incana]
MVSSLRFHFELKDITPRFGALLSAIMVTFSTGSHDRSMRRWDRIILKNRSLSRLTKRIQICLTHQQSLRRRIIIYILTNSLCGNGFARWLYRYASYYYLENLHSCWQV